MSISAPNTTNTTASTTGTSSTSSSASGMGITEDQFLQMLMAELQNQNPMDSSSTDPMQFVQELAQFTSVEQETDTADNTATLDSGQSTASAVALIGDTVNYTDPTSGNPDTGTVQSVEITSSGPTLTINGTAGIDPSTVTEVS
ncbi:MAG TPA: flagellar hook capping FlgD N-terminal domain-containing protein [Solirubrobacteraceae bacterium]|nr:flagellar hook capping FlgD N-terminal domain-containing protein [Solirubrobacteraceae bacterium]